MTEQAIWAAQQTASGKMPPPIDHPKKCHEEARSGLK
jgi:hypothetical protein